MRTITQLGLTNLDHVLSCQFRLIAEFIWIYTVPIFLTPYFWMYLLLQIFYIRMWAEGGNLINDLLLNVPLGFSLMKTSSLPTKCSMTFSIVGAVTRGLCFCGPLPRGSPTTRSYDKHGEGQWVFPRQCSKICSCDSPVQQLSLILVNLTSKLRKFLDLEFQRIQFIWCIILPPTWEINYVNMQHNYVNMWIAT